MAETLQSKVEILGAAIMQLCERLKVAGYVFRYPDEVFPGPESDAAHAIAAIEREAGEIPAALKLFWLHVGSVDLFGEHPEWKGAEYPDPLVVFPPSVALAELDDFLQEGERILRIPIAPDYFHKANVSGGPPYNIYVPAESDDPPLHDERHEVSFLTYLAVALEGAGFPGLEASPGHTWPISSLRDRGH